MGNGGVQSTAEIGVFNKASPWPPPTAETYLSQAESEGGLFPQPPNAVYPALSTAFLFTLLDAFNPIQMAYFNNNNADLRSGPSGSGVYAHFPSLSQTLATNTEGPVDPRYDGPSYGERYSSRFIDRRLTRREPPGSATSHASNWPRTSPNTRADVVPTGRFRSTHTRADGHRNAEAGPSTLVVPPAPYTDPLTPQPAGGISKTMADAENTRSITEEHRTPASNFYWSHIPRVTGRSASDAKADHGSPLGRITTPCPYTGRGGRSQVA